MERNWVLGRGAEMHPAVPSVFKDLCQSWIELFCPVYPLQSHLSSECSSTSAHFTSWMSPPPTNHRQGAGSEGLPRVRPTPAGLWLATLGQSPPPHQSQKVRGCWLVSIMHGLLNSCRVERLYEQTEHFLVESQSNSHRPKTTKKGAKLPWKYITESERSTQRDAKQNTLSHSCQHFASLSLYMSRSLGSIKSLTVSYCHIRLLTLCFEASCLVLELSPSWFLTAKCDLIWTRCWSWLWYNPLDHKKTTALNTTCFIVYFPLNGNII